ncbi:MAG: LamG-like jellyroll fold domain-containing protein [Verrucomicrobiales bacterium]
MKIAVPLAAFLTALVLFSPVLQAEILLSDNFDDNSLDGTKWVANATIPAGGASVTETNQRIEIVARGHLVTANDYDPVAEGGIKVTGRWTFAALNGTDFFQALIRSDGVPAGQYGETQNGVECQINTDNGTLNWTVRGGHTINVTQTQSLGAILQGQVFDFEIIDYGPNGQVSWTMTEVGGAGRTATSTATITATDPAFTQNKIAFHNREDGTSARIAYLDNVVIESIGEDTDQDDLPDSYEITYTATPGNPAGDLTLLTGKKSGPGPGADTGDYDNDGRTDLEEVSDGTDPTKFDTDGDDLSDGDEYTRGTNPKKWDTDGDGLGDGDEVNGNNAFGYTSDPLTQFTDSDPYPDGTEVAFGADPDDDQSVPTATTGLGAELRSYWRFDDSLADSAHGVTTGSSVNDEGVFVGPATDVGYSALGKFGAALSMNGGSGYVRVPDSSDVDFDGESLTISCWIKATALSSSWQAAISHGEGSDYRIARYAGDATNQIAYAGGATDIYQTHATWGTGGTPVDLLNPADTWHHIVAITENGVGTRLWVDGVLVANLTGGATLSDGGSAVDLFIGANPEAGNREWSGLIDDVALWGRVLTADEIADLWDGGTGAPVASLLQSYNEDSDDDDLPDGWERQWTASAGEPDGNLTDLDGKAAGNGPGAGTGDFDGDGRTDLQELTDGTDPTEADADNDGLNDGEERDAGTNPKIADTDEDGINDGDEVNGNNPRGYTSDPLLKNTDGDPYPDAMELAFGTDPDDDQSFPPVSTGIAAGLKAYYPFDTSLADESWGKSTSSEVDDSGIIDGPSSDAGLGAGGKFGQALVMNGGDAFVRVKDSADVDFDGESLSISLWVKASALTSGWQAVISHGENSDYRIARYGTDATNQLAYRTGGIDIYQTHATWGIGGTAVDVLNPADTWHHVVAITENGVGTRLWIDGNLVATQTGDFTISDDGTPVDLLIGANPEAANREWNGCLDDVALWSRVLTEQEIADLYNGGAGTPVASLLFKLDDIELGGFLTHPNGNPMVLSSWPAGRVVADLTAYDGNGVSVDPGETTFSLVAGDGDTDNALFQIGSLQVAGDVSGMDDVDVSVRIGAEARGSTVEKAFALTVGLDSDDDDLLDSWERGESGTESLDDLDGKETGPGPGPGSGDFDQDGITDFDEYVLGTEPRDPDSDGDDVADGQELIDGTNPKVADSDDDGLNDGEEKALGTNPREPDSDGDNLTDGDEVNGNNPFGYTSDPKEPDTDMDGYRDDIEVANGSDPDDNQSKPPIGSVELTADNTGAESWLTPGDWDNNAEPTNANEYLVRNGLTVQSPAAASPAFPGVALILGDAATGGTLSLRHTGAATINELRIDGASTVRHDNPGAAIGLSGAITQSAALDVAIANANSTLVIGATITGSSPLNLSGEESDAVELVGNNAGFSGKVLITQTDTPAGGTPFTAKGSGVNSFGTGDIEFIDARWDADYDIASPAATLTMRGSNAQLVLDQDHLFGAMEVGPAIGATFPIPEGTYFWSDFEALGLGIEANIIDGGGSITIMPEDPDADDDGDGQSNGAERTAGTDKDDPASVFRITDIREDGSGNNVITWSSVPGITYEIRYSPDLATPFATIGTVAAEADPAAETSFTDPTLRSGIGFYDAVVRP